METGRKFVSIFCILGLLAYAIAGAGCATPGQTGAAVGAGTGALIGGLANINGSWGATALLGAGVGAGIGYLIGNEQDKRESARRQQVTEEELRPLAGTSWQVIKVVPESEHPERSIVSHFRQNGTVVTTKTSMDGRVEKKTEHYRIVGSTLILSAPGYVENAKFRIEGDKLHIDYGNSSAVLQHIS